MLHRLSVSVLIYQPPRPFIQRCVNATNAA